MNIIEFMERIMTQDEMKFAVAQEALKYVVKDTIIGVGTGSTANFFIDALATMKDDIKVALPVLLLLLNV